MNTDPVHAIAIARALVFHAATERAVARGAATVRERALLRHQRLRAALAVLRLLDERNATAQ